MVFDFFHLLFTYSNNLLFIQFFWYFLILSYGFCYIINFLMDFLVDLIHLCHRHPEIWYYLTSSFVGSSRFFFIINLSSSIFPYSFVFFVVFDFFSVCVFIPHLVLYTLLCWQILDKITFCLYFYIFSVSLILSCVQICLIYFVSFLHYFIYLS